MFTAYCYASGEIEFGEKVPSGALPIVSGRPKEVRELIDVKARHGKGDLEGEYLVPGVPETEDKDEAVEILIQWIDWIKKGKEDRPLIFGNKIPA